MNKGEQYVQCCDSKREVKRPHGPLDGSRLKQPDKQNTAARQGEKCPGHNDDESVAADKPSVRVLTHNGTYSAKPAG